jgi:hypothetical protein
MPAGWINAENPVWLRATESGTDQGRDAAAGAAFRAYALSVRRHAAHFCAGGLWATPWMARVLPVVTELAGRFPERTVFTSFVIPEGTEATPGMWQHYYWRWR